MARVHSYVNLPMGILGLMHSTTSKEALHARISWNWLGCWQIVAWILYFSGPLVEWVRLKMGGWPTKLEVYNQPVSCDVRACIANKITFGLVWKLGDLTAKEDQASFSAKFKRKGEHFIRPWKVRDETCGFVQSKPLRIPEKQSSHRFAIISQRWKPWSECADADPPRVKLKCPFCILPGISLKISGWIMLNICMYQISYFIPLIKLNWRH